MRACRCFPKTLSGRRSEMILSHLQHEHKHEIEWLGLDASSVLCCLVLGSFGVSLPNMPQSRHLAQCSRDFWALVSGLD